jgi:hypothetical protein
MANSALNSIPAVVQPALVLTAEEFEKLRISLRRINRKAQRVQTATLEELKLLDLSQKFALVADHVRARVLDSGGQLPPDRLTLDRNWNSCRYSEIPTVRGFIPKAEGASAIEPVATDELKSLMEKLPELENKMTGVDWGTLNNLCSAFHDNIMGAIVECRNVIEQELREIQTITANL